MHKTTFMLNFKILLQADQEQRLQKIATNLLETNPQLDMLKEQEDHFLLLKELKQHSRSTTHDLTDVGKLKDSERKITFQNTLLTAMTHLGMGEVNHIYSPSF